MLLPCVSIGGCCVAYLIPDAKIAEIKRRDVLLQQIAEDLHVNNPLSLILIFVSPK